MWLVGGIQPTNIDLVINSVIAPNECDITVAGISISKVTIDYFEDLDDTTAEEVFNQTYEVSELSAGESQTNTFSINIFQVEGCYLITAIADDTNTVLERDENNNTYTIRMVKAIENDDIFNNASNPIKEKLSNTSAIVVIGKVLDDRILSFKGIPIYHAQ